MLDRGDPGCWSDPHDPGGYDPSGEDEDRWRTQCHDTVDNDSDGAVDLGDPECSDPIDDDESQLEPRVVVTAECVFENGVNDFTAYFSYLNPSPQDVSIRSVSGTTSRNEFSPPEREFAAPDTFAVGRVRGAASVRFDGTPVTWVVQAENRPPSIAVASASSPRCLPVKPTVACIRSGQRVVFGYENPNPFTITIPAGGRNEIRGTRETVIPLTSFPSGTLREAFEVPFTPGISWRLEDSEVAVSRATESCVAGCVDVVIVKTKEELDSTALKLAALATKAAKLLEEKRRGRGSNSSSSRAKRDALDSSRAIKKATRLAKQAQALVLKLPDVSRTCSGGSLDCRSIDRWPVISALRGLYAKLLNQVKRSRARRNFKVRGITTRFDALVAEGKRLKAQGEISLSGIPRVATDCA